MTAMTGPGTGGESRRHSPFSGLDIGEQAGLAYREAGHRPMFEDPVWYFGDVAGLPVRVNDCDLRLDFEEISDGRWRLVAKEYLLARLAPRLGQVSVLAHAYRIPLSITSCHHRFRVLAGWLNWLRAQGTGSLAEVTQDDCDRYLNERRQRRDSDGNPAGPMGESTVRLTAAVIIELGYYAELFTLDRYQPQFVPWNGRSASMVAGARPPAENTTPVLGQHMLAPMLSAALYLTGTLAPHMITVRRQVREYLQEQPPGRFTTASAEAIRAVLRHHQTVKIPLEQLQDSHVRQRLSQGWDPGDPLLAVSFNALARQAGKHIVHTATIAKLRSQIEQCAELAGIAKPWARQAAQVPRAGNAGHSVAWTEPLDQQQARDLGGYLLTACLLVTATLTGMRECELMELRAGCRRPPADPATGRYRLAGKLIKGQPPGGTADEWVVIPEVDQAITVAEQLAALDGRQPGDLLFGRYVFFDRFRHFRKWVNGPAGQHLGLAPIPEGTLNQRMLRRTIAQEIAYQPGGLLAAKIALKHVSVATTEGYAARPGGAQAKLLAEIAAHEHDRNQQLVLAQFRGYQQGTMPAGPGARDLAAFFDTVDSELKAQATTAPGVLESDQQVINLLAKRAGVLHLGIANYCWFTDPSKALCLKLAGTPAAQTPLAGMCDSARCPQATHHPCHRPAWAETVTTTTVFLGRLGRTHTTERVRLQGELDRARRILDAIDAASPATDRNE